MNDVTLHLGDCLEYMRGMEAGSVDAVVTDPPYGINYTTGWLPETVPGDYYSSSADGSIYGDKTTELRDLIIEWAKDNQKPLIIFGSSRIPDPKGYKSAFDMG